MLLRGKTREARRGRGTLRKRIQVRCPSVSSPLAVHSPTSSTQPNPLLLFLLFILLAPDIDLGAIHSEGEGELCKKKRGGGGSFLAGRGSRRVKGGRKFAYFLFPLPLQERGAIPLFNPGSVVSKEGGGKNSPTADEVVVFLVYRLRSVGP